MTKTVPLHELQPGDVVSFPSLTVQATLTGGGEPPFAQLQNGLWASYVWMEGVGATATREVPDEPEYPLTWAEALDAMVQGKVCGNAVKTSALYRMCDGCLEINLLGKWSLVDWIPIGVYKDRKWRIVESSGN